MESILETIKKMLNISESDSSFDTDIIVHINSALNTLNQLGVGLSEFHITGPAETWEQLLGLSNKLNAAKSYVYIKVRLMFDPPTTSFFLTAYENQLKELEWRLTVEGETGGTDV